MSGETQTSSIRDSLNAAVEKVESAGNEPVLESTPHVSDSATASNGNDSGPKVDGGDSGQSGVPEARARDATGKFSKGPPAPKVEAKASTKAPVAEATQTAKPTEAVAATTPPPVVAVTTPTLKAPQSWKADVREQFAALPPSVQAEVLRREAETQQMAQSHAEPKKHYEQFKAATAPYEQQFAARGMNSLKAVTDLLPTALALHTGTPEQKAQTIAQAIQAFGIPVDVLARALDGQPPRQTQQQQIDPRTIAAQVRDEMRQEQENEVRLSASQEFLDTKPEFYSDVEHLMPGVIQAALAKGEAPSAKLLQAAYDQACWADPTTRGILQQRAASDAAKAQIAASQNARNASVSVKTTSAAPTAGVPKTRREALEEAAAKVGR